MLRFLDMIAVFQLHRLHSFQTNALAGPSAKSKTSKSTSVALLMFNGGVGREATYTFYITISVFVS